MSSSFSVLNTIKLIVVCSFFFLASHAFAAVTISPLIIDVQAEPRDTEVHDIVFTNPDGQPVRLYASVHEIAVDEGSTIKEFVPASMSDRTTSVTSWLEISRARIDIPPGGTTELPLTIRIHHDTPPGLYHAFVGFGSGSNRDVAEAKVLAGQGTGVVLRISVGSTQKEQLRLVSFTTDRFSVRPEDGFITYTLENTGDLPLTPTGDVIIYDGRGQELTTVALAVDADAVILPGEQKTYTKALPYMNRIGKNKAYLTLEYGTQNTASLYDTNFYYSMPWFYLVIIMLLLATVLTALIVLVRRNSISDTYFETNEAQDVPLFVGKVREHNEYEHDINLKQKDS